MAGWMGSFLLLDDQEIDLASATTHNLPINSSRVEILPQADNDQITGFDKQFDMGTNLIGPLVILINIHASRNLILKHNNTGSTDGNRILTADGKDMIIPPFGSVQLGWEGNWYAIKTPYDKFSMDGSGNPIKVTKKAYLTVTPSTGNGHSVDITSCGFSNILSVNAIAVKNTSTATSVPNVAIKSVSTTAIVLNIIEGNSSLVTLLGSGVLLGVATLFANVTGLTIYLTIEGN